jgi:non-specific serine/threonine protein kinase
MAGLTIETLSIERIQSAVGAPIFDEGTAYYQKGLVNVIKVSNQAARCQVGNNRPNLVEIQISNNYLIFKCDCRHGARGLICEHDVAAALAVRDYLIQNQPSPWKGQLDGLLQSSHIAGRKGSPRPYLLFYSLQEHSSQPFSIWKVFPYQLPLSALPKDFRLAEKHLDPPQLHPFIEANPNLATYLKSPSSSINPTGCVNCPPESVILANVLLGRFHSYSYYYSDLSLQDYLAFITRTQIPIFLGDSRNPLQKGLEIKSQAGEIFIEIERDDQGLLHLTGAIRLREEAIRLDRDNVKVILTAPLWVLAGRSLFKIEEESQIAILSRWLDTPEVIVSRKDEAAFLEKYYLPLARQAPLQGKEVTWEEVQVGPARRLYLTEKSGELHAGLRFAYGEHEVHYESALPEETILRKPDSWTLVRIQRQPQAEQEAYQALSGATYGLKRSSMPAPAGEFTLRARVHPVDFLLHLVPHLARDGFEVYGEEQIKSAKVNRNKPTLSFNVSSGIDWFDVQTVVNFGEIEVALKDIRRALKKRERYVKLADGTIGELPDEWLERYRQLFALGEESEDGLRFSRHHLTLIDELLSGAEQVRTDAEFEARRQRLLDFSAITPRPLPQNFYGELRPYQKSGYDWLHFLHEYQFGGCLADDMGLGKTIQALVFLQSLYEASGENLPPDKASLVVVPRSLLVNWQREAARFTPQLRVLEYFDHDRIKDTSAFDGYHLVITTYGVMLRDIESLSQYPFYYVLLDESQTIKNPLALTGKAARSLNAKNRLVLTGTPVENSTVELWSQFAFLNPGLLGNLEYFKEEFGAQIERKGNEQTAQFLRKMVFPFILRRTKEQVAPELPPRTERILYCDMEPAQRKLYNRTRDIYRGMLLGMLEAEGLNNTRMKILEGLLRLRQICNHPLLMDSKFRGESGKYQLLLDTLDTLSGEGHKVLVFSQFVQMLRLVRRALDERQASYLYLDGHTQNRQEKVDNFQNDPQIPLFLISLKAGGQGLNLTAADYVIHIDPWWNPAVEMQASDRTHRIGQDKPVFIYKLIVRDSVEEKIMQLQERKRNLVEQIITTDRGFFKELTAEDVKVLFS